MISWQAREEADIRQPQGAGWVRLIARATLMALVIYGLLIPFWIFRLLRLSIAAQYVVQAACVASLKIMGIRLDISGTPMQHHGAIVSNHASWLDIFSLNAAQRAYFVSKSDVRDWPGIGILARSTGTEFIKRQLNHAHHHKNQISERLLSGDKLLFFPEGTSTDGRRVLPFRSSLFAAFFEPEVVADLWVQPITLSYIAPKGEVPYFYGWWGDMSFVPHLMMVLSAPQQGHIELTFHPALKVAEFASRKTLTQSCEIAIRSALKL